MIRRTALLLNDDQMKHFLVNGYVPVKTGLPRQFHQEIYEQIQRVDREQAERSIGNNLLPRIPKIQEVFDDPAVHGALVSVMGDGYCLHAHRYPHVNPPGGDAGELHKDSDSRRRHCTRHTMAIYYPQDTPEQIGPTGAVPGSQYFNTGPGDRLVQPLCGEAGTVFIVHYDLWHQVMANQTKDQTRYMLKFLFDRMAEPTRPTWSQVSDFGDSQDGPITQRMWTWHCGRDGQRMTSHRSSRDLIKDLHHESELISLNAAYTLGGMGSAAVPALTDALHDVSEMVRRNATYGLSAVGGPAVGRLIDTAHDPDAAVRAAAVDTLGDIGLVAQEAIPTLARAVDDQDVDVRRHAAEALGITSQQDSSGVGPLTKLITDPDDTVRQWASLALARIGTHASDATEALQAALRDPNRYVCAHALHALRRIDTPDAREAAFDFLTTARWCDTTSNVSPY